MFHGTIFIWLLKKSGQLVYNGLAPLILRVLGYKHLNAREAKYLIWRYGCGLTYKQIVEMDGVDITPHAACMVILRACRKIKKM